MFLFFRFHLYYTSELSGIPALSQKKTDFSWIRNLQNGRVDEMINNRRTSLLNENYEGTDWTSPAISVVWSKTLLHFS